MQSKKSKKTPDAATANATARRRSDIGREIGEGALGAVAGAAMGAVAGPPGAVIGAIIGAAAGTLAGAADVRAGHRADDEDKALDEDIGVTEGSLGAPNLLHPAAKTGLYSGAAAGAGTSVPTNQTAEGPMSGPKDG